MKVGMKIGPCATAVIKKTIVWSLVFTHYQRVTDRRTDRLRDTPPMPMPRSSIADRDNGS